MTEEETQSFDVEVGINFDDSTYVEGLALADQDSQTEILNMNLDGAGTASMSRRADGTVGYSNYDNATNPVKQLIANGANFNYPVTKETYGNAVSRLAFTITHDSRYDGLSNEDLEKEFNRLVKVHGIEDALFRDDTKPLNNPSAEYSSFLKERFNNALATRDKQVINSAKSVLKELDAKGVNWRKDAGISEAVSSSAGAYGKDWDWRQVSEGGMYSEQDVYEIAVQNELSMRAEQAWKNHLVDHPEDSDKWVVRKAIYLSSMRENASDVIHEVTANKENYGITFEEERRKRISAQAQQAYGEFVGGSAKTTGYSDIKKLQQAGLQQKTIEETAKAKQKVAKSVLKEAADTNERLELARKNPALFAATVKSQQEMADMRKAIKDIVASPKPFEKGKGNSMPVGRMTDFASKDTPIVAVPRSMYARLVRDFGAQNEITCSIGGHSAVVKPADVDIPCMNNIMFNEVYGDRKGKTRLNAFDIKQRCQGYKQSISFYGF